MNRLGGGLFGEKYNDDMQSDLEIEFENDSSAIALGRNPAVSFTVPGSVNGNNSNHLNPRNLFTYDDEEEVLLDEIVSGGNSARSLLSFSNNNQLWGGTEPIPTVDDQGDDGIDQPATFAIEKIVDPDTLRREQLLKEKIVELKKKLIESKVRTRALRKEFKELGEKLGELKAELQQEKEKVRELRELKDYQQGGKIKFNLDEFNKKGKKAAARTLFGDDDTDGGLDVDPSKPSRKLRFYRLRRAMRMLSQRLNPLKHDLLYIEAHFGDAVGAYFNFARWQVIMTSFISVFVFAIHIVHFIRVEDWGWRSDSTEKTYVAPQWLLYSSFSDSENVLYIVIVLVSILYYTLSMMIKIVQEGAVKLRLQLLEAEAEQTEFSQLAFNCWDHSSGDKQYLSELRFGVIEKFKVMLNKEELEKKRKARKKITWIFLFIRRALSLFLVLLLILGTWVCLISLNLGQTTIKEKININVLSDLVVPLAVTVINFIVPKLAVLLTFLEAWDNPTFLLKAKFVRLYLLKIIALILQIFQYYELLSGTRFNVGWLLGTSSSSSFVEKVEVTECQQNNVGSQLFLLIIASFIVEKASPIATIVADFALAKIRKKNYRKPEFDVPAKLISLIYFQFLVWITIPFFPFAVAVGVLMMYISFKYDAFVLRKGLRKPAASFSVKDSITFFMFFFVFTFIISLVYFYYTFVILVTDVCGPIRNTTTFQALMSRAHSNATAKFIVDNFVMNPIVLWALIALLVVLYYRRSFYVSLIGKYLVELRRRMFEERQEVQDRIRKLNKNLEKYKKEAEETT